MISYDMSFNISIIFVPPFLTLLLKVLKTKASKGRLSGYLHLILAFIAHPSKSSDKPTGCIYSDTGKLLQKH